MQQHNFFDFSRPSRTVSASTVLSQPLSRQQPDNACKKQIQERERQLVDRKILGFFPTPPELCQRLVRVARIRPGSKILEPSAGKGDLAQVIRRAGVEPDCLEIEESLAILLRLKGFSVRRCDFLSLTPEPIYDRVVQNPPFFKGSDAFHVRRAYNWLKPGGRLVSVMCQGTLFRRDRLATAFRGWLDGVGGRYELLPDGSFASAWRPTQVRTVLVVVDRRT